MEFSDEEIAVLDEVLIDEDDRNDDQPGRSSEEYRAIVTELRRKVRDEAKRRGFWWAR